MVQTGVFERALDARMQMSTISLVKRLELNAKFKQRFSPDVF